MADGAVQQLISAVISVGVSTAVSVLVTGYQTRDTTARNALAAAKESTRKTVEDIALAGKRYWRTDGQDLKSEGDINSLFDALDLRLSTMFEQAHPNLSQRSIEERVDGLFVLTTGGSYATAGRTSDRGKVELIADSADEVIRHLLNLAVSPKRLRKD